MNFINIIMVICLAGLVLVGPKITKLKKFNYKANELILYGIEISIIGGICVLDKNAIINHDISYFLVFLGLVVCTWAKYINDKS